MFYTTVKKGIKAAGLHLPFRRFRYLLHRYLIQRNIKPYYLADGVTMEPVDDGITFFGYYNISPENSDGDVLYLKTGKELTRGSLYEDAAIMLKTNEGRKKKIGRSKSWNWQQGCMLQWLGRDQNHILYNDYDAEMDNYVCKVIDTEGNLLHKYDMPVNNVEKNGNFALCLNYDRLASMRPDYGYFNKKSKSLPNEEEDGIWKLNFRTGEISLIISLKYLKESYFTATMKGAAHKVNHIDINPSGSRFMFLHRWVGPEGRFMRLVTAKPDGSDILILNGNIMTSHCCWLNDREILSFCEYRGDSGYFLFSDRSEQVRRYSDHLPRLDGHPSVSPKGNKLILDTYPEISRFSRLYLYCIEKHTLLKLGSFHQPSGYLGEFRVDLHPKWSYHADSIYVESAHVDNRKLYKIKLPE